MIASYDTKTGPCGRVPGLTNGRNGIMSHPETVVCVCLGGKHNSVFAPFYHGFSPLAVLYWFRFRAGKGFLGGAGFSITLPSPISPLSGRAFWECNYYSAQPKGNKTIPKISKSSRNKTAPHSNLDKHEITSLVKWR